MRKEAGEFQEFMEERGPTDVHMSEDHVIGCVILASLKSTSPHLSVSLSTPFPNQHATR
jgi:hypothetical protein